MGNENNRLAGRVKRYARVGVGLSGVAVKLAGTRIFGDSRDPDRFATDLAKALGGLRGPLMKIAQLLSAIPDALPPAYAEALGELQSNAPPMGWSFVKRRMRAELGDGWQAAFADFNKNSSAAASLGQVHRAVHKNGRHLACKLQYPDMASTVEADLNQLEVIFALHRRMQGVIDTSQIALELSDRIREELDYIREAKHILLYRSIFQSDERIQVPETFPELSTGRLLTMEWLEGRPLLSFRGHSAEQRNKLAEIMFRAWWMPLTSVGIIHGDPHPGNYSVFGEDNQVAGINLLDYGCIRIFPPQFVGSVVALYRGLEAGDEELIVSAYEAWGFKGIDRELIDILNIWARFIYGPMLDDRKRSLADGIKPGHYGRKEAFRVHTALKARGPLTIPREFVFMDRAAIGLGGAFLHLGAELNFYQLFQEQIDGFELDSLTGRQQSEIELAGLL